MSVHAAISTLQWEKNKITMQLPLKIFYTFVQNVLFHVESIILLWCILL